MRVSNGPSPSLPTGDSQGLEQAGKRNKGETAQSAAEKVASEFETLFLDLVMKGMRQTAKPEDQSNAEDIFTGMLDQEYAKTMTEARDFGVKSLILDWMKTADPKLALEAAGLEKAKAAGQGLEAYRAQAGRLPKP